MFSLERELSSLTVRLVGDIGGGTAHSLFHAVVSEISNGVSSITLDFANVKAVDSYCVRILISIRNHLNLINGTLHIINVPEDILRVFCVLDLDRILDIDCSSSTGELNGFGSLPSEYIF